LGRRIVNGPSLVELSREPTVASELRDELAVLDQYSIPTCCPNGLPAALP